MKLLDSDHDSPVRPFLRSFEGLPEPPLFCCSPKQLTDSRGISEFQSISVKISKQIVLWLSQDLGAHQLLWSVIIGAMLDWKDTLATARYLTFGPFTSDSRYRTSQGFRNFDAPAQDLGLSEFSRAGRFYAPTVHSCFIVRIHKFIDVWLRRCAVRAWPCYILKNVSF